jgi:hypothetical protein
VKSQDIALLTQVTEAITGLAAQGDLVNVKVLTVVTRFPDGSVVGFTQDEDSPELDWHIYTQARLTENT